MTANHIDQSMIIRVDGQEMVLPSSREWAMILSTYNFRDIPALTAGTEGIAKEFLDLTNKYPKFFSLGLEKNKSLKFWMPFLLYKEGDRFQRVHIESVKCPACGVRQKIANPAEPSLYFSLTNGTELLRKSFCIRRVSCPRCGGDFDRPAIWVEDDRSLNN